MNGALAGKRIVNTRAVHQADEFNELLRSEGAVPVSYPCIDIAPPEDLAPLDAALTHLVAGHFNWLVLTSVNTVFAISRWLDMRELTLAAAAFSTIAVGPTTAEAALRLGLRVLDLPIVYTAESLANAMLVEPGVKILLPASAIARPALAEILISRGADVTKICAYRTICASGGADVPQLLTRQQIDALAFTSASTVIYFNERLKRAGGHLEAARAVGAACIGPHTAAAARNCGFTDLVIAQEHTAQGLVAALGSYFARLGQTGERDKR